MESVDQLTLVIRLHRINEVQTSGCCRGCHRSLNLGEGGGAVGLWLALTEQVQVGAAQHEESITSGVGTGSRAHRGELDAL